MKSMGSAPYFAILWLLVLLACTLGSTPPAPAAQGALSPTEAPTQVPASTLTPINLLPPVEVGSNYLYWDGTTLVPVPAGEFTMGHGGSDNPVHQVTLGAFWIYSTKVTNQQYAVCVQAGKCISPDPTDNPVYNDAMRANDPVVGVTWDQASTYCSFVDGSLPTEAQWEKTARGPNAKIYPWGDGSPSCDLLNFNYCVGKHTDVTQYPQGQSYYKALDMEGNAFEWVADWYDPLYYQNGPTQEPLGPATGQERAVRSSSYRSGPEQTPASTRFFEYPQKHRSDLGFRCVVDHPGYFAPACQSIGLLGNSPSAGASGGQVLVHCPKVNITLAPVCHRGVVDVTVTDDTPNDHFAVVGGLSSCPMISGSPGSFPQTYECSSGTTATINSWCTYTISGPLRCGLHYKPNTTTGMCEWDGTGTTGNQCPPGNALDPANQCCTAQPGSAGNYPACPSGTTIGFYTPFHTNFKVPVCVPNNLAHNPPYHSELVSVPNPATCGENPGVCKLTVQDCYKQGQEFVNPITCTCYH